MIIQAFPCQPFGTNAYVVACPATRLAVAIDPAPQATPLLVKYLVGNLFELEKILLTHSHWDHIADVAALKRIFDVPVYVHSSDRANLETPGADGLPLLMPIEGVTGSLSLDDGASISVGGINFKVIHTPGHTPGGICLYCEKEGILFTGDTLFKGTIGNLSFPTSSPESMWASLHKLAALPPETKVYPGHGAPTTIGKESWLKRAEDIFGDH